jgi:hypothetical protein
MLTGGPHLSAAGVGVAYPFGHGRLAGLGRLSGLGRLACPRPLFILLFKTISFSVFETKGFVLQQILHRFESLQICNICIMARGFLQTRRKSKKEKIFEETKISSHNLFDQFLK